MKISVIIGVSALMLKAVLKACMKNDSGNGKTTLSFHLTDDPVNFDVVYIDIVYVEVTGENGATADLNVNAGI
jgi:hypothetical protein